MNVKGKIMWGIIIALISGTLMSIQGVFNTEVTKSSSIWAANAWVQITAFLICMAAWFITGRESLTAVFSVSHKYMLLGGVIGAFITWTVIQSMSHLGPAPAVLIIVVSQVIVAYLIELFGIFGVEKTEFNWTRLLGMVLAIAGIFIFQKK